MYTSRVSRSRAPDSDVHMVDTARCEVRTMVAVGREMWIAQRDGSLAIRDCYSGAEIRVLPCDPLQRGASFINCMCHVGDGVWAACSDGVIRVYDQTTKTITHKLLPDHLEHHCEVLCLAVHDLMVYSSGRDCHLHQWDGRQPRLMRTFEAQHRHPVTSLVGSGTLIYSGDTSGLVVVWDAEYGRCLHEVRSKGGPGATVGSGGGVGCMVKSKHHLWVGTDSGCIVVYGAAEYPPQLVKRLSAHRNRVLCLQDLGTKVVSGSMDHSMCVWNATTLMLLRRITEHHGFVLALAPALRMEMWQLWSAAGDKSIKLWDIAGVYETMADLDRPSSFRLQALCEGTLADMELLQQRLQAAEEGQQLAVHEAIESQAKAEGVMQTLMEREKEEQHRLDDLNSQNGVTTRKLQDVLEELEVVRQRLRESEKVAEEQRDARIRNDALITKMQQEGVIREGETQRLREGMEVKDNSIQDLQRRVERLQQDGVAKAVQVDQILTTKQAAIDELQARLGSRQREAGELQQELGGWRQRYLDETQRRSCTAAQTEPGPRQYPVETQTRSPPRVHHQAIQLSEPDVEITVIPTAHTGMMTEEIVQFTSSFLPSPTPSPVPSPRPPPLTHSRPTSPIAMVTYHSRPTSPMVRTTFTSRPTSPMQFSDDDESVRPASPRPPSLKPPRRKKKRRPPVRRSTPAGSSSTRSGPRSVSRPSSRASQRMSVAVAEARKVKRSPSGGDRVGPWATRR